MNRALVLGVNGYLGRHVGYSLKSNGFHVVGCGKGKPNETGFFDKYVSADVTDKNQVEKLNLDVDLVFMFAGRTGTMQAFDEVDSFVASNELGLLNILNHMRNSKTSARLVFPSTRLVYQGQEGVFLPEDADKCALTIYAANKLACESYLEMYHSVFGINYTTYRICVPYGNLIGSTYSYGTIGFFLNRAMAGEDITLFGEGHQRRTFSHVQDISEIVIQYSLLEATKNKALNIGGVDNLSLLEAATLVADRFGVAISHRDWPENLKKIESGDTVFNDARLQQAAPYRYHHSLGRWLSELDVV
jgi:UDP-glucose 4-epimerase